jgi:6-phosphogluconolactonase
MTLNISEKLVRFAKNMVVAGLLMSTGPLCFAKHYLMYVGTYTNAGSKGIYVYRYDSDSGKVEALGLAAETENPSFLVSDSAGKHLYGVNETPKYQGEASGAVTGFSIDRKSGKLTAINQVSSHGADPCYISFDRSGKYVLVANYTGGTVAVFPVAADGKLGEASSVVEDQGPLGPNHERQERSHAHWIEASARNRFAYVADLGLDRVLIYKFDASKGTLGRGEPADSFSAVLDPGTGPRHVAFSKDGKFMYALAEMDSSVTVFANDNEKYRSIQKISALPQGFSGKNDAAEIVMHPSGKFLYTSNRGDDSIAVFAVDSASGKLTSVDRTATGGKTPRNFAVDPEGKHLLAANEETGNVVEFAVDGKTGKLTSAGEVAKVASAVCVVFVSVE